MNQNFDCRECGRCCFGQRDYVQVFAHDAARLGEAQTARFVASAVGEIPFNAGTGMEPRRFMTMTGGRCAALQVSVEGQFNCAVYEDRPTLCRVLEPGGVACLEARAQGPSPFGA